LFASTLGELPSIVRRIRKDDILHRDLFAQAVPMTAMNAAEGAEAVALRVRQAAERLLAA
jgi:O-acetylhomoserine/O-acetylserine sulfhydrylase-like pyridoxal-dependent enzyme